MVVAMNPVVLTFFSEFFLFKDVCNLHKWFAGSCYQFLFLGVLWARLSKFHTVLESLKQAKEEFKTS